jgi:hypothetical protein
MPRHDEPVSVDSRFSLVRSTIRPMRTGEVMLPPYMEPVKTYKVTVEDGIVFIDV